MKRTNPPAWMEHLLLMLLPRENQETIAGDLREEFHDRAALGTGGAAAWYLRQVVSFAPRAAQTALSRGPALPLLCGFTGLCGLWLGAMDLRLGHPASQVVIAGSILFQALVTIGALRLRFKTMRYMSLIGCAGILWLAGRALLRSIRGDDFEGYILLIALLLIVQSVLTLCTVPWIRPDRRGKIA